MVNREDDPQSAFELRSKALFDSSVEQLNGSIRSRLTQARHRALAQAEGLRARRFWIPAAGLTAAALAAIVVVLPYLKSERSSLPDSSVPADDIAMLLNADDMELIEDIEFYAWMDGDAEVSSDDSDPDVRS